MALTPTTMRHAPTLALAALLLATASGTAGCRSATAVGERDRATALASARERWEATKPEAYRYELRRECDCPPEFLEWRIVEVRDGVVASIRRLDGSEYVRTWGAPTIDDVFAIVEQALASPDGARALEVTYDARWGHPTRVEWAVASPDPGGDRLIVVRDFAPLE